MTLFIIGFYFTNIIFNRLDRKTFNILNLNKDKIDLLFLGSSHSYSTFNSRIFDNKLGVNTYVLSSDGQPIAASYYLLKELYKRKKPEIVVFELYGLLLDTESKKNYENVFNSFRFGINKIEASKIFDKSEQIDYLIPILKYHSIWKEPSQIFKNIIALYLPPYKGSTPYWENSTIIREDEEVENYLEENFEIDHKNIEYLKLIKNEVEKNNGKLILTVAPVVPRKWNYKVLKLKEKIEKEISDTEIIDYNTRLKDLKIDIKDFLDHGHLNNKGSIKISEDFSNYLNKNYTFKEKNYILNNQKSFPEFYFYGTDTYRSKDIKEEILTKEVTDIIKISRKKDINYFLHLLDSSNVGVIKKDKIKKFIQSKERFDLYIKLDSTFNKDSEYEIQFFKNNNLKKKILKNNKEDLSKDNLGRILKIPKNDIWIINNERYLVEKNIFLSDEIDRIVLKKIN